MFEDSVLFDLTFHHPGIRRKADKTLITTAADKDQLGLSKAIIDSDEYRAICTIASNCRKWLEARSGKSILKRGTYMIRVEVLDAVYEHVEHAKTEYMAAVETFMAAYPAAKEKARVDLVDQFDEANYPDAETLRKAFYISKRVLDVSPPGSNKVSEALKAKELKQWREDMAALGEETRQTLRKAALDVFTGFRQTLANVGTMDEDGKKVRFNAQAVKKAETFLELFYHRDITNDTEMQAICADMKSLLDGVDNKTLKSNDAVRAEIESETGKIVAQLDGLLEAAPTRLFTWDDEEPAVESETAEEPELAAV